MPRVFTNYTWYYQTHKLNRAVKLISCRVNEFCRALMDLVAKLIAAFNTALYVDPAVVVWGAATNLHTQSSTFDTLIPSRFLRFATF